MTTENGLDRLKAIRNHVEWLRDRLEYLEDKDAEVRPGSPLSGHYVAAEIAALRWVIPVAEAEWDSARRFHAALLPIERKLASIEAGADPKADEDSTPVVPVTPDEYPGES